MQVILGRLSEAEKTLRQAIQQATALGREAELVTAHHHLGLALLAHERGDDNAAAEHLQSAADLGKNSTLVDWLYRWNLAQARLKESAGEWDAALALFEEARRVYVKNPVPMLQSIEAHKARVYIQTRSAGAGSSLGPGGTFQRRTRSATWMSTIISPWPECGWPRVPLPGSMTCWNACWHWQKRKNGGVLFLLDAAGPRIVRVEPGAGGDLDAASVSASNLSLAAPHGIAYDVTTGHLHVMTPADRKLYELSQAGETIGVRDLTEFALKNPQGMVFAPSGDQTDDPAQLSLYVADGSAAESSGQVIEYTLVAPAALPAGTTMLSASLVRHSIPLHGAIPVPIRAALNISRPQTA